MENLKFYDPLNSISAISVQCKIYNEMLCVMELKRILPLWDSNLGPRA